MIPQILINIDESTIETHIFQFAHTHDISDAHVIMIKPEKDELTVDQIHLLRKDIQYVFKEKILVAIVALDASSNEVQNSLLKCLEEESERIQFLFVVKNPTRLLPTILSRCTIIPHNLGEQVEKKVNSYENYFSFQNNSECTKEQAIEKIDTFIQHSKLKNHAVLRKILDIRKLVIDNNVNPILALDHILLFLSKTGTMKVANEK